MFQGELWLTYRLTSLHIHVVFHDGWNNAAFLQVLSPIPMLPTVPFPGTLPLPLCIVIHNCIGPYSVGKCSVGKCIICSVQVLQAWVKITPVVLFCVSVHRILSGASHQLTFHWGEYTAWGDTPPLIDYQTSILCSHVVLTCMRYRALCLHAFVNDLKWTPNIVAKDHTVRDANYRRFIRVYSGYLLLSFFHLMRTTY